MNGSTAPASGDPRTPRKPRLLLVEDEPAQWIFLCEVLQPLYDVEVAMDGLRAWEIAQHRTPDIVLADVVLPGIDGFSLARRLRGYPETSGVPIILLSASNKIELLVRGLQAGAYDVMLKPVVIRELLDALQSQLAAKKA